MAKQPVRLTDASVASRFAALTEGFHEIDKLFVNKTSYEQWKSKWLPAFAAYFHGIKDEAGNPLDEKGDVFKFWNGRLNLDNTPVAYEVDTHIVDSKGKVIYVVPTTLTTLTTTLIDDPDKELPLTLLTADTMTNSIAHLIPLELQAIFKKKMGIERLDMTSALRKALLMDYIFVKEGYASMLGLKYNSDGSYELTTDTVTKDETNTPKRSNGGDPSDAYSNIEYEDID